MHHDASCWHARSLTKASQGTLFSLRFVALRSFPSYGSGCNPLRYWQWWRGIPLCLLWFVSGGSGTVGAASAAGGADPQWSQHWCPLCRYPQGFGVQAALVADDSRDAAPTLRLIDGSYWLTSRTPLRPCFKPRAGGAAERLHQFRANGGINCCSLPQRGCRFCWCRCCSDWCSGVD